MAVSNITYSNKVALNENPSVADINKVKADDMNEIKSVVNNNAGETNTNTTNIANLQTYSTSEVNTGKIWIDGKPIYRKVFTYSNVAIANDTPLEAIITSDPTKIDIVKMEGVYKYSTGANRETRPFPIITSDGKPLQIRWVNNYIKFSGTGSWASGSDRELYVIIEYTKTT